VVATRESLYGADSPQLLSSLENLSIALSGAGEVDESVAVMERALRIATATFGDGHPKTEAIRDLSGSSYFQAGRLEDARAAYEQAVTALAARVPANDRTLALVRYNLGEVLLDLGRIDDAARETTLAHDALSSGLEPDHPYLGYTLTLLGRIALARDDAAEATRWLEQASTLRAKAQTTALERASTDLFLALALRSTDASRSASLLAQARQVIESDPSPDAARLRKHLE
jgi:tetratricopeptide (TPR) repeat protein